MNIAVFAKRTTFHKGYGGMETQNKLLCEGLSSRGHKITIFSPDWGITEGTAEENGIKYVFVKCVYRMGPVFGFFGTLQKSNWLNRSYEEFQLIHNETPFDLILAQSSTGLGLIKRKEEHGVPIVSISHGTIIGEYRTFVNSMSFPKDLVLFIKNTGFTLKNFFRRQRDFVNGSERVIAVSNYVRTALIDETFTNDDRIVVINNGVDPSPFFPKEKKLKRGKKLLYVGQVIKSKGMEEIVKMFKDKSFSNYQVDVVGGGDFLKSLKSLVEKDEDLKNSVNVLGKTSSYDEVVEKYYKNEDYGVMILPTKRYEGLPMVLVEAMFSGLPAIVYDNGGVGDAVEDGVTGYVIKNDSLEEFKSKVIDLLEKEDLRNKYSDAAINRAHAEFTLEKMLDKYENVFMEVTK